MTWVSKIPYTGRNVIEASRDDAKPTAPDDTDRTFRCRCCECGVSRRTSQQPVSSLVEAERPFDYRRSSGSQSHRPERPQLLRFDTLPGKRNLYYRTRRIKLQERRCPAISAHDAAADRRRASKQQPYPVVLEPLSQLSNIRQHIPADSRSENGLQFALPVRKKPGQNPAFTSAA